MSDTLDARAFEERLQRLEGLIHDVERFADPAAQSQARAIVQALLELHAVGLERLFQHVTEAGEAGQRVLDACAKDNVVSGLLLLHGLHPLDVQTRVRQALDQVAPYLRSHGGSVELVAIEDDVVRLRLQGSCHSCPSSAATMQQTIEQAIYSKAPEVTAIEVDGMATEEMLEDNGARVALPLLGA